MTKNALRREQFRKRGSPPTDLEREWRAYLGESPNPWSGAKSAGTIEECDDEDMKRAGPQVMQILTQRGPSKLERRSMEMSSEHSAN